MELLIILFVTPLTRKVPTVINAQEGTEIYKVTGRSEILFGFFGMFSVVMFWPLFSFLLFFGGPLGGNGGSFFWHHYNKCMAIINNIWLLLLSLPYDCQWQMGC